MWKIARLAVIVLTVLVCSCGGGGSGSDESNNNEAESSISAVGSGCEGGVAGYYVVTYSNCPTGMLADSFNVTQSSGDLTFSESSYTTLYGTIDSVCGINMSATYGSNTYDCVGSWSDEVADMTCDAVNPYTGEVNGNCQYRARRAECRYDSDCQEEQLCTDNSCVAAPIVDTLIATVKDISSTAPLHCDYFSYQTCSGANLDYNPLPYIVDFVLSNTYFDSAGELWTTDLSKWLIMRNGSVVVSCPFDGTLEIGFTTDDNRNCVGNLEYDDLFDKYYYSALCWETGANVSCGICYEQIN